VNNIKVMVNLTRVVFNELRSPKGLYKDLLRKCDLLPKSAGKFYKQSVRKEFEQHRDEKDTERVDQIVERAVKDMDWILKKYT